jgi:hypothetical protein
MQCPATSSEPYVVPYDSKRSKAHEAFLYLKRGNAPNRLRLTKIFFKGASHGEWVVSFRHPQCYRDQDDSLGRLADVFVDEEHRLYFMPQADDDAGIDDVSGVFLLKDSSINPPGLYGDDRIFLYKITPEDVERYFPIPSSEKMARLTQIHMRSPYDIRLVDGHWNDLLKEKKERMERDDAQKGFIIDSFYRKDLQTTGRVSGEWFYS